MSIIALSLLILLVTTNFWWSKRYKELDKSSRNFREMWIKSHDEAVSLFGQLHPHGTAIKFTSKEGK